MNKREIKKQIRAAAKKAGVHIGRGDMKRILDVVTQIGTMPAAVEVIKEQPWENEDDTCTRCTDFMNFGLALEAAKMGKRIARRGWNGKGMSVAYQKGYPDGIPCNKNTAEAWGMEEGELFKCNPYLQMRCADGSFQMWTASQSDILADDWYIVE